MNGCGWKYCIVFYVEMKSNRNSIFFNYFVVILEEIGVSIIIGVRGFGISVVSVIGMLVGVVL